MIAIEFKFTAGQYHATPWGRHVNEGDIEWPPSPWRVMRALIAIWYRKADTERYPQAAVAELIGVLAARLPVYHLPRAVHTHTRHYMPMNKNDTTLVYDAFARVSSDERLVIAWVNTTLTEEQMALLCHLVDRMSYLGRAESWIEGKVLSEWSEVPNCYPADSFYEAADTAEEMQSVSTMAPLQPEQFVKWRAGVKPAAGRKAWIPNSLLEAMSVDTGDLEKTGWSAAPGMRSVLYLRPYDALAAQPSRPVQVDFEQTFNVARFALGGRVLPNITEALMMGELMHLALMSHGGDDVSSAISGRDANDRVLKAGHRHGFCLPEDSDGDGKIDHLLFVAKDRFPDGAVAAIQQLADRRTLWTPKHWPGRHKEWSLYLEMMGSTDRPQTIQSDNGEIMAPLASSKVWRSCTPYLHPWFARKGGRFGPLEQIQKELKQRGLPEVAQATRLSEIPLGSPMRKRMSDARTLRPEQFRRRRLSNPRQSSPDAYGSFWLLRFAEPVTGPLALGFACHYGLGMFVPANE